ncbi:MAG: hypothetical protein ACYTE8_13550, partial [Planctomycetota bacterium]
PVQEALVWLEAPGVYVEPSGEQARGKYFFASPGTYTIHAVARGYPESVKEIVVEPTDITARPQGVNKAFIRFLGP